MSGWLANLSNLHVRLATLFERVDKQSGDIHGLALDVKEAATRIAHLEGKLANSLNSEVLKELGELRDRLAKVEVEMQRIRDASLEQIGR